MKKLLVSATVLQLFFSAGNASASEQNCFRFALEPVRVCLSANNISPTGLTSVTIYDLQNQRLLADFQTQVYSEVNKTDNFEVKFKSLIESAQAQPRFLKKYSEGHSDLSSMRFASYETPIKGINFGKLTIGNSNYVYLNQLDKVEPLEDLAH